jgi:Putative beta barrel porin-7 (BBP7)
MTKGFVGALSFLLAGAGLAFAQSTPPAQSAEQPAAAAPATQGKPSTPVIVDSPRSPYWPGTPGLVDPGAPPGPGGAGPGCGCAATDEAVPEILWASAEYLVWWVRSGPSPVPLVTTSGTASQGILGNPDTRVLIGGQDVDYHYMSGGRATVGFWFDPAEEWGFEGTGLVFERRTVSDTATSGANGSPVLARPFVNAITGAESSVLISSPGQFGGSVVVDASTELYGFETNIVKGSLFNTGGARIEVLAGFRYLHLDEELAIRQDTTLLPGGTTSFIGTVVLPPATLLIRDSFMALNDFYGGQLGVRGSFNSGRWSVDARAKLALGSSHEVVRVVGFTRLNNTSTTGATPSLVFPGGLLAVSSNSGRQSNDTFAAVPELGFNVGYLVCPHLRIFAGYTFLWWSDVVRPGDSVSRLVNPTLIPSSQAFGIGVGPAVPQSPLKSTDYWAQGLNFGVEFRY